MLNLKDLFFDMLLKSTLDRPRKCFDFYKSTTTSSISLVFSTQRINTKYIVDRKDIFSQCYTFLLSNISSPNISNKTQAIRDVESQSQSHQPPSTLQQPRTAPPSLPPPNLAHSRITSSSQSITGGVEESGRLHVRPGSKRHLGLQAGHRTRQGGRGWGELMEGWGGLGRARGTRKT